MSAWAYYNEIDPYAVQWLKNLINAGHIAPGFVDDRSIVDVKPEDLSGFTQCHFFAGIGVWSLALRNAGWPDDRPVWTGSCPCQPFSAAGKQLGNADERHLAPVWLELIEKRQPPALFGEQVAAAIGKHWLDDLFVALENQGYACGAAVLPACGVGAPHKRERLWFGAQLLEHSRSVRWDAGWNRDNSKHDGEQSSSIGEDGILAISERQQCEGGVSGLAEGDGKKSSWSSIESTRFCLFGSVADSNMQCESTARNGARASNIGGVKQISFMADSSGVRGEASAANPTNGHWRAADWLFCRDGKWRPVEPSTFPLANGVANRVGRLRAYGNAISPQAAKEFIAAFMSVAP